MRYRSIIVGLVASLCCMAEARADIDLVGDIDNDGLCTYRDVRLLVDYMMGRDTIDFYNGHEWVDLGLPSGRLWATMNVGATLPSEAGGYFAWGETHEKETYTWDNYKWTDDSLMLTRYCRDSLFGRVDSLATLLAVDDAARHKWGGRWRMPTREESFELYQYCDWTSETQNGQAGFRVTAKNGCSIFLPMAGYREGNNYANEDMEGFFWASELNYATDDEAYGLLVTNHYKWWAIRSRYTGRNVRACAHAPHQIYDVNQDGRVSLADLTALINLINSD